MDVIYEFRLSPPGSGRGVVCDENGAFIGSVPLLRRAKTYGKDRWEPRECSDLSKQIGSRLGLPIDMSAKAGGIKAIANALNEGNVARAQVAAVLMGIPDPPPLTKGSRSHSEMIKFIRELHWSGLIKVDWDSDEHPRWPAGAPDSQGGQFAPKGTVGAASETFSTNFTDRDTRIHLADAGMSDASDDPIAEAAAQAAIAARSDDAYSAIEQEDKPNLILAAAEGEDERDPRFGIGGNHPPPE